MPTAGKVRLPRGVAQNPMQGMCNYVGEREKGKGKANFGNVPNGAEFAQFVAIKLPRRHAEMCIRMENTHTHTPTHRCAYMCCILFGA